MMEGRLIAAVVGTALAPLLVVACGSDSEGEAPAPTTANAPAGSQQPSAPAAGQDGHWDESGQPVRGGPVGADGSTGNNLTQEYCARNEDPGCPVGTYVGPNAILNPDGSNSYVPCEGTICTNPNRGAGDPPDGDPVPPDDSDAEPPVEDTTGDDGSDGSAG